MYMSCALFLGPSSFCIIIESALERCISDTLQWKKSESGWWKDDEKKVEREK